MSTNALSVTNTGQTKLKPKQLKALSYLVLGYSQRRVSRMVKVSEATVSRWLKDPTFSQELETLQATQRDLIQGQLGRVAQHTAKPLLDGMRATDDEGKPHHSIRLRAARTALSAFEALSRKSSDAYVPPAGPLIVLPAGTSRMALVAETGPQDEQEGAREDVAREGRVGEGEPPKRLSPGSGVKIAPAVIDVTPEPQPVEPSKASGPPPWFKGRLR